MLVLQTVAQIMLKLMKKMIATDYDEIMCYRLL